MSSSPGSSPRWPPVMTSSVSSDVCRIAVSDRRGRAGPPQARRALRRSRSSETRALAQVGVDEQRARARAGERDGEAERDRRLAVAALRARDDDRAQVALGEEQVRAQVAQRLGDDAELGFSPKCLGRRGRARSPARSGSPRRRDAGDAAELPPASRPSSSGSRAAARRRRRSASPSSSGDGERERGAAGRPARLRPRAGRSASSRTWPMLDVVLPRARAGRRVTAWADCCATQPARGRARRS